MEKSDIVHPSLRSCSRASSRFLGDCVVGEGAGGYRSIVQVGPSQPHGLVRPKRRE